MSTLPIHKNEIFKAYHGRIDRESNRIRIITKGKNRISIARLITVLAGLTISWYARPHVLVLVASLVLFLVILVCLISLDTDKTEATKYCKRLIKINEHEIAAMEYNLKSPEYDDGTEYAEQAHAYASDLDLFGPSSLFLWINRCHAEQSKKLLAFHLKTPLPCSSILEKQEAVKELALNHTFCQRFQAAAMADPVTESMETKLKKWLALPDSGYQKTFWQWIKIIYPIFPLTILILYISDYLPTQHFVYCLISFYLISYLISRKTTAEFELISNIAPEINTLHQQFLLIEKEKFNSRFLRSLHQKLTPPGYSSASASIGEFNKILKKIDWRNHMLLNPILQVFLLWDLRLILQLNEWKLKTIHQVNDWFGIIAETEVMISLASLTNNEPEWCFPEVDNRYFHFESTDIGHPLIPGEKRVTNDFLMEGNGKISVITGSNMAGKSTFLRSIGINTVLACMGAPVCAKQMSLSELKLMSSMRVADNLAENTSTFYAELKKLQFIIESVNRKEPVFILLDEVLRGTNSTDRQKGTRALVRQLLYGGAVAVIATHDTELALSESAASESVYNYHFDAKIVEDELYFDYKIKKGICESLNATTLMKKIGIHFQD